MAVDSDVMALLQELSVQLVDMQQHLHTLTATVAELRDGRQPHDPLLGARDIWGYLGRGRSWFYEARKNGNIPPPDRTVGGRGGERWHRSTIDKAMQARSNGRVCHG